MLRTVAMYAPAMTDTNERPGLSKAEPPPIPNDSPAIADLVIADMLDRKAAGIAKYGVALQANNGRDPLVDAYQEAMDLTVYLRQAIAERWVRREEYDRLAAEAAELRERVAAHEQAASRLRLPVGVNRDARLADHGGVLCSSPGGGDCPSEGWHYIFGGPYTAYTMPETDDAGALSWFVYDEDEASWREVESLGIVLVRDEDLGVLADGAKAWAAHSATDRDDITAALDSCGFSGTEIGSQPAERYPLYCVDAGHSDSEYRYFGPYASVDEAEQTDEMDITNVDARIRRCRRVTIDEVIDVDGMLDTICETVEDQSASGEGPIRSWRNVEGSVVASPNGATFDAFVAWASKHLPIEQYVCEGDEDAQPPQAGVAVPVTDERSWTDASDPIVETWIGMDIECTSAMTEPWTCKLKAVEGNVLRFDHGDAIGARVHRKHLQVRLVSEAAK
jgi:hypothetical protein